MLARIDQEKYDALSDELKAEYTKGDDGKFTLKVDEIDGFALENVGGLKKVLAEAKDDRSKLREQLKVFEGIENPEEAKKAAAELAKLREEIEGWEPPEKWKASMDQREAKLVEKHTKERDELQKAIDDMTQQLERVLIEAEATAAISEHKGNVALLLPHVKSATKMEKDAAGNYVARVLDSDKRTRISMERGSTDPMGIREFVGSLKDTYPTAFEGTNQSGSGGGGSDRTSVQGNTRVLGYEEAKDIRKYRQAKEAAQKAGQDFVVADRE